MEPKFKLNVNGLGMSLEVDGETICWLHSRGDDWEAHVRLPDGNTQRLPNVKELYRMTQQDRELLESYVATGVLNGTFSHLASS